MPYNNPFFVDLDHPANATLLRHLDSTLGEARPDLVSYFDQCIEYLLRVYLNSRGTVQGYPVFAEMESGVILAAVCGQHTVALRYQSSGFRQEALDAGAKANLEYDGKSFDLGEDWVFTDGKLDLKRVRHVLPLSLEYFSGQVRDMQIKKSLDEAVARAGESPVNPAHDSNIAFSRYFQALNPKALPSAAPPKGYGTWGLGVHPDIPEWLWVTLPTKATLPNAKGWFVHGCMVLVHPDSGVIFAYMTGQAVLGLRLAEPDRSAALQTPAKKWQKGETSLELFPVLGPDWITFQAFAFQEESASWLTSAYTYAGKG